MRYRVEAVSAGSVRVAGVGELTAEQAARHCANVVGVQRAMYADAARDVRPSSPGMPRVSIFRVKEHMDVLERTMEAHLQWYGEEAVARVTRAAAAQAAPPPKHAKPAKAKAGGASGGFGGGGGGAKAKAKGKGGGKKGKKK